MAYKQGFFKPKHPEKYKGDPTNIVYRSGWELRFFRHLDEHKNVTRWSSEEVIIQYRSPITGRVHRYFPDCWVETINSTGEKKEMLVEIKPLAQTKAPMPKNTSKGKPTRRFITEVATYGVNQAKWEAARAFCAKKGWDFTIVTEEQLFGD